MVIQRVIVLGCGVMGQAIVCAAAGAGMTTVLCKVMPGDLGEVRDEFLGGLEKEVKKGRITPETKAAILANLYFADLTRDMSALKDYDLVIESVVEDLAKKQALFRQLDGIVKPEAIFASNTSTLSIADLASVTGRADRFVGLHFFQPVSAMHLVEVAHTKHTTVSVKAAVESFVHKVCKKPIVIGDTPGFVVNRLLMNSLMYAIRCFEEGVAKMEDIDKAMKLGLGHPMGPFALCDFIGLDIVLAMAKNLCGGLKDQRFAPPSLLLRLVNMGMLGRKTKLGFYDYSSGSPGPNWAMRTDTTDGM